jgi:phosphorylcholine metabolism protein LicD
VRLAHKSLEIVSEILDNHDVKWTLGHGTLIGAIRTGDFLRIGSDVDIDTINVDEKTKIAIKEDLDKVLPFDVIKKYNNYTFLLAYRISGMRIDIHFLKSKDKYVYRPESYGKAEDGYIFYKLPSNIFDEVKEFNFRGIKTYIPNPPESYLDTMFKKDEWRVDKLKWHTKRDSPCIIKKEECPIEW